MSAPAATSEEKLATSMEMLYPKDPEDKFESIERPRGDEGKECNGLEEVVVSTDPAKMQKDLRDRPRNSKETRISLDRSPLTPRRGRIYCLCWKLRPGESEPRGPLYDIPSVMGKLLSFFPTLESKRPMENPDLRIGMTDLEPYGRLTVYEYLEFVGRLHHMTKSLIHERILYLSNILQLPSEHTRLGRISAKEYYRVALAAALVHSPSLLILNVRLIEQGTSYRERVWDFLRRLSREEGLLILVITPDFIEAEEADEDACCWLPDFQPIDPNQYSPLRHKCRRIAKLGYRWIFEWEMYPSRRPCQRCEDDKADKADSVLTCTEDAGENVTAMLEDESGMKHATAATSASDGVIKRLKNSWHRIPLLVANDLIEYRRFKQIILWPMWTFAILNLCVATAMWLDKPGYPPRLPVAVVQSNTTSSLAEPFLASLRMRLEDDSIRNETVFKRKPYVNLDEALASVESGDTCGVLRIGENLSTLAQYRILLRTNNGSYSEESTLDIDVEAVDQETRFYLQHAINVSFWALRQGFTDGRNKSSAESSFEFTIVDDPVFGSRWTTYFELRICALFMVSLPAIAFVMTIAETNSIIDQVLARNFWALGITRIEKAFATFCSLLCIVVSQLILVLLCMLLLNYLDLLPLKGSLTLVASLILMQSFKGMTVGLTTTSLFTLIDHSINISPYVIVVPVVYPIISMTAMAYLTPRYPKFLEGFIDLVLPIRSIEALRYILYRGWGIERDEIQTAFKETVRDSLIFLLLSTCLIIVMFIFIVRRLPSSAQTGKGQLYRKRLYALTKKGGAAVSDIRNQILRMAKDAAKSGHR